MANIIASEKSITDPRLAADPIITKQQNIPLYKSPGLVSVVRPRNHSRESEQNNSPS